MFRLVLSISFLTCGIFCFAETTSSADSTKRKHKPNYYRNEFFIAPSLSLDYSYRRLLHETDDDGYDLAEDFAEIFDSIESPRISYSVGLMGDFVLNQHLGVQLGVYYSDKGRKQHNMFVCYNDGFSAFSYSLEKDNSPALS